MALGSLFIMRNIFAVLVIVTIIISLFNNEIVIKNKWFRLYELFIIISLAVISFTALPDNYIIYKSTTIFLAMTGVYGIYLDKLRLGTLLLSISMLGNFYIAFVK